MKSPLFRFCVGSILVLLFINKAYAHQSSDSFLSLSIENKAVNGQWAIAVRDLDLLAGLDLNQDGVVNWGEIRAQETVLQSLVFSSLTIESQQQACDIRPSPLLTDRYNDGAYLVFPLQAICQAAIQSGVSISYQLLFDIDTQHRGLLKLSNASNTLSAVFRPNERRRTFEFNTAFTNGSANKNTTQNLTQLWDYLLHGVWHIWIGIDHILFLLTLLLPAVLIHRNGVWKGAPNWRYALIDTVKIVTAFTIAHSITLGLATTGVLVFPSQWVEVAIAASVIIAAANNLYPFIKLSRWLLSFVFGLVHGLGFATVLSDLSLGTSGLFLSLLGFNLGVELGQLVIVGAWFPLAYCLRHTLVYRQLLYRYGSSAAVIIATFWLYERVVIY